jgi:hypothetical protein
LHAHEEIRNGEVLGARSAQLSTAAADLYLVSTSSSREKRRKKSARVAI